MGCNSLHSKTKESHYLFCFVLKSKFRSMKQFISIFFLVLPIIGWSQKYNSIRKYEEKAYNLLLGYNYQSSTQISPDTALHYLEIGLHRTHTWKGQDFVPSALTYGISTEYLVGKNQLFGLKAGISMEKMLFVVGVQTICYTDFSKLNFVVRPEIGLGLPFLKATVGYNYSMSDKSNVLFLENKNIQLNLTAFIKLYTVDKR